MFIKVGWFPGSIGILVVMKNTHYEVLNTPLTQSLAFSMLAFTWLPFSVFNEGLEIHTTVYLTRMYIRMLLHVALLMKPFIAMCACVRPRVRVDEQVRGQGARALEALAALGAAIGLVGFGYKHCDSVNTTFYFTK